MSGTFGSTITATINRVIGNTFGVPWGSGLSLPPASEKLIAWLKGPNTSTILKRDYINGYDFTIQNCAPDYLLDGNNDQILDGVGDPIWGDLLYTGWGCEYLAPESGAGYTALYAIDDGTLFSAPNTANTLDIAVLEAIASDQMFFCKKSGKGFGIYSEVLVGDELNQAESYFSCFDVTLDSPDITMDSTTLTLDSHI